MKVCFKQSALDLDRRLLCVTHTDRPVDFERCRRQALQDRFGRSGRLPPQEPFASLKPSLNYSPFLGEITLWEFEGGDLSRPSLQAHLRPDWYMPKSALVHAGRLWVLGVETLEVYDGRIELIASFQDPWLAGAHMLAPDGSGRILISCSGSDSVLVVDERTLTVSEAFRMPEALYGHNYDLKRGDSVAEHYIVNDAQLTHVNSVTPWKGGVLVTTLMQGAVGWFDPGRHYHELTRGFTGCHGGRVAADGGIYFSDSCSGKIIFLNEDYSVKKEVDTGSRWLHDALQLDAHIFAVALSDHNEVRMLDIRTGQVLSRIPGAEFGNSTQFITYALRPLP